MSGAVDTKTVEMRFDNKDFESNAKQTMSTLARLKSALKLDGASKGLSDIEKASKKLDFRDLDRSLDSVGHKFSALESIAAGVFFRIGQKAADAGLKVIKSFTVDQVSAGWDKYAEKITAVQTIMSNLRDTTGKFVDEASKMDYVNKQIEKLNWFSDETSYSLTDMTSNIGKFIANGQNLEESVTAMQGIATWAAMSGQNTQVASRAMYNISQALGVGSMQVRDWMSIENANMATAQFKELAITVGQNKGKIKEGQVTIENFRESLSGKDTKGWFDKDVMMDVFQIYGEAATAFEEHWEKTGQIATEAIREINKGNKELAKEIGVDVDSIGYKAFVAAQEAKTFKDVMLATADAVSTKWAQIFELIFGNYLEQKVLWTDLANDLWDIFAAPLDDIKNVFKVWNKGFDGISGRDNFITSLKNVFDIVLHDGEETVSLLTTVSSAFKEVFGLDKDADALGKRLWDLTKRFKEFTDRLKPSEETLAKIKNSFKGLFTLFKIGGKFVGAIIKPFKDLFGGVLKNAFKNVLNFTEGFGELVQKFDKFLDENKVFETVSNGIKNGFLKIRNAVKWLYEKIPVKDSIDKVRTSLSNFFKDTGAGRAFQKTISFVASGIKTAINDIKQVASGNLPEQLSPIQKFVLGIGKVFDFFKGAYGKTIEAFPKVIEKIKSFKISDLKNLLIPIKNFWETSKTFISSAVKSAFGKETTGEMSKGMQVLAPIIRSLKSIFDGLGDLLVSAGPYIEKVGQAIGTFLSNLGDNLSKIIGNKSGLELLESAVKIFKEFATGDFLLSLSKLNTRLSKAVKVLYKGIPKTLNEISAAFGGAKTGIAGFFQSILNWITGRKTVGKALIEDLEAIRDVLKAYKREINAKALVQFAAAIGILAASMYALAQIPSDRLQSVGKALVQLAAIPAGFYALGKIFAIIENITARKNAVSKDATLMTDLMTGLKDILTGVVKSSIFANDATAKFLKASAAIALFAIGFSKFSKSLKVFSEGVMALGENASSDQFKNGLKALGWITGGIAVLSLFIGLGRRRLTSALIAVLPFIILTKSMSEMVEAITALGENTNYTYFKSGLFMFSLLASVVTVFISLNTIGNGRMLAMFSFFISMLSLIAVANSITNALRSLAKDTDDAKLKQAARIVERLAKVMLAFLIAFDIIEKVGKKRGSMAIAGAAMLAAAGGIYIIALALSKIASIDNKDHINLAKDVLKSLVIPIGGVLTVLGLVSGLNFRIGSPAGLLSGTFFGTLGVPIGALSFVVACAGIYIMALAFNKLGDVDVSSKNVDALKSLSTHIGWITGLLGLAAGMNIGGYATAGAVGISGGFFGTLGVPVAALSFAAACQGVYVMAEALSMLSGVNVGSITAAEKVIKSVTGTIAWTIGLLGALAGLNVGALAGPALVGFSGTLGVPVAALSFAAACQGVYVMAEALSILATDIDPGALKIAADNINEVTETIGTVLGLLGVIAGFTGLGILVGAVSFDYITQGIEHLVDTLEAFSSVDLSNLEENCRLTADALKTFFENAGDAINIAIELGTQVAPVALKLGAAVAVLGLGLASMGYGLDLIGSGLSSLGEGAVLAAYGILVAAESFSDLKNKDLSGIGKNLFIISAALLGISVVGVAASPGLIILGFAIESIIGPITNAINAIDRLMQKVDDMFNWTSNRPGIKISAGSFLPGWVGRIVTLAETIVDAVDSASDEVEEMPSKIESSINSAVQSSAPALQASGQAIDSNVASGIESSGMAESAAYKKYLELLAQYESNGVLEAFTSSGSNWMAMLSSGIGGFNLSGIADMKIGEFLTAMQNGGEGLGPIGLGLASMFGDSFSGYDFEAMAKMSLDEVVSTLSNGQIDVKTAGELLTSAFGDEWKNFDWKNMTMNDVLKIITATFADNTPDVKDSASDLSKSGAEAMEQEDQYGAAAGRNALGYARQLRLSKDVVSEAAKFTASSASSPFMSLPSGTWGSDLGSKYASGIMSSLGSVKAAAMSVAAAVRSILHFSEPDEGPLSDFHTYAPDMIKLWCSGIYSNLDKVENSSDAMADTIYDGFSTALNYVSDLIDNGMSDELTIRPVMDLTEIQNGVKSLNSMIGRSSGYTISGTAKLASTVAYGMGDREVPVEQSTVEPIAPSTNNYNTFNITNDDPNAVAERVSRILDQGARRQQAVWAR